MSLAMIPGNENPFYAALSLFAVCCACHLCRQPGINFCFSVRGGSRGRVQGARSPPTPHRDDLRFSNTNGILKKKLCGLLVLKWSKRRVHPLLKKILDPPLSVNQSWEFHTEDRGGRERRRKRNNNKLNRV